jgi:oxalate decarboxylase/phosphoglucose isomerase-like protein (cupin superfamily)
MEELYVVVSGRATFTVDDETTSAPPGSLIFVPPGIHRRAEAAEDGTIVFAIGGAVGRAFESSGWGNAITADLAAEDIDLWYVHYDAGCHEVSARRSDDAFEHLRHAKELDSEGESAAYFREDSRLDPLRDDPRFQDLLA